MRTINSQASISFIHIKAIVLYCAVYMIYLFLNLSSTSLYHCVVKLCIYFEYRALRIKLLGQSVTNHFLKHSLFQNLYTLSASFIQSETSSTVRLSVQVQTYLQKDNRCCLMRQQLCCRLLFFTIATVCCVNC